MTSGEASPPPAVLGAGRAEGRIYDLGYQHYVGPRLGRRSALRSLFLSSLRRAWGIGRPFRTKIYPWGLLAIALIPALIALGIAALISTEVSPFRYAGYYRLISLTVLLFCAAAAPEIVCPDQRHRVLSLYFSRGIDRLDYVAAKFAALLATMLVLALVPQLLLFAGNAFAATSTIDYVRDNLSALPRILASALLLSLYFSAIALAFASYTGRRIFASGAFVAVLLLSRVIVAIVQQTVDNDTSPALGLLSLYSVPLKTIDWIFDTLSSDVPGRAELPGALWLLATLTYTLIALFFIVRRYLRLTA